MENGKVVYAALPLGIKNTREKLLFCIIDCQEKLRNKRTQGYWIKGDPPEEKQFTLEDLKNFAKARAQVWDSEILITFEGELGPIKISPPMKIDVLKEYDPKSIKYKRR